MNDFLGEQLSVGDKVIGMSARYENSNLIRGVVSKILNKVLIVKCYDWHNEDLRILPDRVVKLDW